MKKAMKQSTMIFLLNTCSTIVLLSIAVAFLFTVNMYSKINTAYQNRFDLTLNANRFLNASSYLTDEVRSYAATGDKIFNDNYFNEVNVLKNRDIGVKNMKAIGITAQEQAKIDEMSSLSNELVPLEEKAIENVASGNRVAAIEYVFGESYSTQIANINKIKDEFLELLDTRTEATVQEQSIKTNIIVIVTFSLTIMVILMQILCYYLTKKKVISPLLLIQEEMGEISTGNLSSASILTPDTSEMGMLIHSLLTTKHELKKYIEDITKQLSLMASGNMNTDIIIEYKGDFAPIKSSLQTILQFLNRTLLQIHQSSEQVAGGADHVASGAQALSQGATEQASSVEELAATITDISNQVTENTKHAIDASKKAHFVENEANESNQRMQNMLIAMNDINQSSGDIAKIIKTIEDIAFQTNILALNAAVEAARAGAAGKGFAVVADEVRNLASKSAEASKNTSSMIENSLKTVENGAVIANETANSMKTLVDGIQDVCKTVEKISSASEEQATSISQVTLGMDQISSVVQTNSATAEQSAAASQELSDQAQILKNLVNQFQFRA